jgi:four helix bundle protein
MDKENTVKYKSLEFAKRIVKLYKYLCENKSEYVLSKQLLRSGTSVGANIAEAECGISRKDFLAKMYIAYKECVETVYWLELLLSGDYINEKEYQSIMVDCDELRKMLSSITKTTKNNSAPLTPNSTLSKGGTTER